MTERPAERQPYIPEELKGKSIRELCILARTRSIYVRNEGGKLGQLERYFSPERVKVKVGSEFEEWREDECTLAGVGPNLFTD